MNANHNLGLHRFAVVTACATFLLLIAGALVTSNDAGLAVPDWPLSYGSLMPPMVGNIVYEHGHRIVATFVGLLTIVLAVWLGRREPRRWVRRLGWAALGVIVLQGVLGGLTVLFLLPRPVSIGHASLAQAFFCLAVTLALVTGRGWAKAEPVGEDTGSPSLQRLSVVTTAAVFLQLILGAGYRHSAAGIVPHLVGAAVVSVFVVWTTMRVFQQPAHRPALRRPAAALLVLLLLQLVLGGAAYWARLMAAEAPQPLLAMVTLTVTHVAGGALVLAATLIVTLEAHRLLVRPGAKVALVSATERAAL